MINISGLRIGNFCFADKKARDPNSASESNKLSALDRIRAQVGSGKDKTIYQIVSIKKDDEIEILNPQTHEIINIQSEDVYPIELNPNILRSCGFRERTFTSNDLFEKYLTIDGVVPIRISEYREQTEFSVYIFDKNTSANTFLRQINYLHQLQNLYFELTGNNLVIDLSFEKKPVLN